jgi:hypothetical protein
MYDGWLLNSWLIVSAVFYNKILNTQYAQSKSNHFYPLHYIVGYSDYVRRVCHENKKTQYLHSE